MDGKQLKDRLIAEGFKIAQIADTIGVRCKGKWNIPLYLKLKHTYQSEK